MHHLDNIGARRIGFSTVPRFGTNRILFNLLRLTIFSSTQRVARGAFSSISNRRQPTSDRFSSPTSSFFRSYNTASAKSHLTSTKMSSTSETPTPRRKVVVVGSANQDLISYASRFPSPGETVLGDTSRGATLRSFETLHGGKGANQAVAAAKLNVSDVEMIVKVGRDPFGTSILENFDRVGVRHAPLYADSSPTGTAVITVDTASGDNTIIVHAGANADLSPPDIESAFAAMEGDSVPTVVLVQLEIPYETALEALKIGKRMGAVTILNPAPAPENCEADLEGFWEYVDVLVPNESELRMIVPDLMSSESSSSDVGGEQESLAKWLIREKNLSCVICTLGSKGALVVHKNGSTRHVQQSKDLPTASLPVVDTIGAGDSFCGALSTYLSTTPDPKSSPTEDRIHKAAQFACGVASISVKKQGAMTSYPSWEELPQVLKSMIPSASPSSSLKRARQTEKITFVTGNLKKLEEVKRMLLQETSDENPAFSLIHEKIDLPELQGSDPLEIAREKCKLASQLVTDGKAVLCEDTSLSFTALNGMPGPYIKWFLDKCGHDGLNKMLVGFEDKSATAMTVLAFCPKEGEEVMLFVGETKGSVVLPRGSTDFGWDAIFEPHVDGDGKKTYGEMDKGEKDAISHRGKAFVKLKEFFRTDMVL